MIRRRPGRMMAVALLPLVLLAGCGGAPGSRAPVAGGRNAGESLAALPTVSEPSRLKGLNIGQVQAVLGPPGFKRRDAPAEIWQYRGTRCTLDLFIYEADGAQRVEHVSVRGSGPVAEKDCFAELQAAAKPEG